METPRKFIIVIIVNLRGVSTKLYFNIIILFLLLFLLEIHTCMQTRNPAPQYIKDATIFLEHEVFSGLLSWQHADTGVFSAAEKPWVRGWEEVYKDHVHYH